MNRMDIRRRMLESMAASGVTFAYTGTYDSYGDASQGYLVLKTSGTLTIKGSADLCVVGGGGRGATGSTSGNGSGGAGGAGGYVQNYLAQELDGDYAVTIGAGSTSTAAGGITSVGESFTANGGTSAQISSSVTGRGTSGSGGTKYASAASGEAGVFPWNDTTNFSALQVSGCGGGGVRNTASSGPGSGGAGGGGNGGATNQAGAAGSANTGGGGGGGCGGDTISAKGGGNGGSGVVIICWGYNH